MKTWQFKGAVLAAIMVVGGTIQAQTFSLDLASPSSGPPGADDLFNPVFPAVIVPGDPAPFEVDAISFQQPGIVDSTGDILNLDFSVDRFALGVPGTAVFAEGTLGGPGQAAADVYRTFGPFGPPASGILFDGDGAPATLLAPALVLLEGPAGDNLDGLDLATPSPSIFWSVDAATAGAYGGGATEADVFFGPTVPGVGAYDSVAPFGTFATRAALGLVAADDIDALVVFDNNSNFAYDAGDVILLSLTPASPSLIAPGWTAGDVLIAAGGAPVFGIAVAAEALGLQTIRSGFGQDDNLDALSVGIIPEPATWAVMAALLALVPFARRFRRK